MKRKLIEKVEYLGAKATEEDYEFVAVAASKKIESDFTLFVEIYKNDRECLKVPELRIVMTKKDYESYLPHTQQWKTQKICDGYNYRTIIPGYENNHPSNVIKKIKIDPKHVLRIERFFGKERGQYSSWMSYIEQRQNEIYLNRVNRRDENAKNDIENRLANSPVHSKQFEEWGKTLIPDNYIYYKRQGRYAFLTCSKCGITEKFLTAPNESLEEQFIRQTSVPRAGEKCTCSFCGAEGEYKQAGRMQSRYTKTAWAFDCQKYGEHGIVMSYVKIEKEYSLNDPEKWTFTDEIKNYFEPNRKTITTAYNHGSSGWDNKATMYWSEKITQNEKAEVYGVPEVLNDTCLQYTGWNRIIAQRFGTFNYFKAYMQLPELEILSKMGLYSIVDEEVSYQKTVLDQNGKSMADKLMIKPDKVKMLRKRQGEKKIWNILKIERKFNLNLSEEDVMEINNGLPMYGRERVSDPLKYITITKLMNYMKKVGWKNITEYADYLIMSDEVGYDMTDSIILFPKDLKAAHDRRVEETNLKKQKDRIIEKNVQFANIEKNYKKLNRIFGYSDEKYMIRPASSAGEIIHEGATMHHCVGSSDGYMKKHNEGKTYILLMRKIEEQENSYCTVEIGADGEIRQWYQAYDKKPDKEEIEPWLNTYVMQIKDKLTPSILKAAV